LPAAHGIEADRAQEVAEVNLQAGDDRPDLVLQGRGVLDRTTSCVTIASAGTPSRAARLRTLACDAPRSTPTRTRFDASSRSTNTMPPGRTPPATPAGTSGRDRRTRSGRRARGSRWSEAAAPRERAKRALDLAALRRIREIHGGHAVIEEQAAETRDGASERGEIR